MHVMFLHPNFPAQFGLLAHFLSTQLHWHCTFVTSVDTTSLQLPFNHINYRLNDDEPQPKVFYNPDSVQGLFDHMTAIYRGLRGVPEIRPDLVVGHMSYGTMLYLRNLYDCPFVGYYELLPPPFWGEGMVLRKDFPPPEGVRLFNAGYHTFTHLHLNAVDAAYTPTAFQSSSCPMEWRHKLRVLPEGIDCQFFHPRQRPTTFRERTFDASTKVVTYVSRGLESVRGFDVFMRAAKKISEARDDVVFLIVGAERTNYGHELYHIGGQSFKQWVLSNGTYDPAKFIFLDLIPMTDIAQLFNLSDVHVSLTVPYTVPASMLQAMASGCPVVGSATPPIEEFIDDGEQGLLADFYDADAVAEQALRLLADPELAKQMGAKGRQRITERYDLGACLQRLVLFFQEFRKSVDATDAAFGAY
jgi:glycosyltransferase involved in cell wall biosynthesis